jgi:hypothetical protein
MFSVYERLQSAKSGHTDWTSISRALMPHFISFSDTDISVS